MQLIVWARKQGVDVIHSHGKGAGVYARFLAVTLRKPCVHTPHGVHVAQYNPFRKSLYKLYENLSSFWIDHIVYVSQEERDMARAEGLWRRNQSGVIVNGVESVAEADRLRWRREYRNRLGIDEGQIVVATLSRFDFQKNMAEAFEVAKALPACLFVWIGDGEDSAALDRRARADGLANIRLLGQRNEPLPWLAIADVYLSTSRWEGLPLAILEAMSLGLPVVASNVTGHHSLVSEGGGFLYPLGEFAEAIRRVARLAEDQTLRCGLGERSRRVQRERYSAKTMAQATFEIYRQVLAEAGK
ncbi:hypothetical protein BJI67_11295 [Acidihalobacter aeolianus]|uniref:Uncharacterized protein n=1 Tax=Acidihalobacter aeolianus TaxID=2792603 RepID=A0A1D8K9E2_9GAMM|nr:hypothetical protein BJI67_11295 [Acidihalobacter aeolianus]